MTGDPLVAPFVGERFAAAGSLSKLIAPPYDVISPEQRAVLAERDAHNIVRLILPDDNGDRYEHAATLLRDWRASGILTRDPAESIYVVRQKFNTPDRREHFQTGALGALAVEPFTTGRVKPHEETHDGPKADRLSLLRTTREMFETLLFVTRDDDHALVDLLTRVTQQPPEATATLDDVEIAIWRAEGQEARSIADVAGSNPVYIADGHHRYETAIAYREENTNASRTLGLIVPLGDPGLLVLPTYRIVYGHRFAIDSVVEELRDRFHVRELSAGLSYTDHLAELKSRGTACVLVQPDGNAVALLLKAGAKLGDLPFANEPTVATLDVARIDALVVNRLKEVAGSDARVGYTPDPHHLLEEVLNGDAVAGVMLNPVSLEQTLAVADAGANMPSKATFFMPKVPSGLVMLPYDEE